VDLIAQDARFYKLALLVAQTQCHLTARKAAYHLK